MIFRKMYSIISKTPNASVFVLLALSPPMAGFSSLIPRTSLKHAVSRVTGNLTAPSTSISAARNLVTGVGCDEIYGWYF